jgi:hypothetical protein
MALIQGSSFLFIIFLLWCSVLSGYNPYIFLHNSNSLSHGTEGLLYGTLHDNIENSESSLTGQDAQGI